MARAAVIKISEQEVKNIADKLNALPEKQKNLTIKEALITLKPTIAALRDRGYSLDDIVTKLGEVGVKTSLSTLKSAVLPVKRTGRKKNQNIAAISEGTRNAEHNPAD